MYRIKQETRGNGGVVYTPEIRMMQIFFYTWEEISAVSWVPIRSLDHGSLERAKAVIDQHIAEAAAWQVDDVKYIKYP